jgi:hypothetical protein
MRQDVLMADDEIERLLREIDATSSPSAKPAQSPANKPPAKKSSGEVASSGGGAGGRVAFSVGAAVVTGIGAWVFGVFTPWTDALDMGFAAAGAAFLTGLVAGPPKWFSS